MVFCRLWDMVHHIPQAKNIPYQPLLIKPCTHRQTDTQTDEQTRIDRRTDRHTEKQANKQKNLLGCTLIQKGSLIPRLCGILAWLFGLAESS